MSLTKVTYSMINSAPISVADYGASSGVTDNAPLIQAAIDAARADGGGIVQCDSGTVYTITSPLSLPTGVTLDLNKATIEQTSNNVAIITCTGTPSVTSRFQVKNGVLKYTTTQTTNAGAAIILAIAGVQTSNWLLDNLSVLNAYHSVYVPAGANTFLGTITNTTSLDSASQAFYFGGGASVHTNLQLNNVWALQTNGAEQPASRGFYFSNIQELNCGNIAVDGAQQLPIFIQTCTGNIGNIALERCNTTVTTGGVGAAISGSLSQINIGTVLYTGNTVTLTGASSFSLVYLDNSCVFDIAAIKDSNTNLTIGSGSYYTFYNNDAGSVVYNLSAVSSGTSPAIATNDTSANTPSRTRMFNGATKLLDMSGVYVGVKATVPSTLAYPDGSFVVNSAPSAGGPLGWRRVGSNWLPVSETATDTTANLNSIGNAVNTVGKFEGKQVFNITTNKPVYAVGTAAGDVWVDATGSTAHTPV